MRTDIAIEIAGLGVILYSLWAVAHIPAGTDYLSDHFWNGPDVAKHVNAGSITGVGTGSPGDYTLHFYTGSLDVPALNSAEFKVTLGLAVRDRTVCIRDLYDLLSWDPSCPPQQTLTLDNGFYVLTAYSTCPESGVLGDHQDIYFHLEPVLTQPHLGHSGVPQLC